MMTRRVVAKASRNFKATVAKKLRKVTQDTKNCNDVTGPSKSSTFKSNLIRERHCTTQSVNEVTFVPVT